MAKLACPAFAYLRILERDVGSDAYVVYSMSRAAPFCAPNYLYPSMPELPLP
jgi:hypothetical protein